MGSLLCTICCGSFCVESSLLNSCCGVFVVFDVEYVLWNVSLWNRCCGIFGVEYP